MKTYRVQVVDGVTGETGSVDVEAVSAADARGAAAAKTGRMAGAVTEMPVMTRAETAGADEDVMRRELERLKQVERFEKVASDVAAMRVALDGVAYKMGKGDLNRYPIGTIAAAVFVGILGAGLVSAMVGGFLLFKGYAR
jgi:hypothetical protein